MTIGIFQDRDEQRQNSGRVGDIGIKFETRWDAAGRIKESGKMEIMSTFLDSRLSPIYSESVVYKNQF